MPKKITLQCIACQHQMPYQPGVGHCPICQNDWLDPLYDLEKVAQIWPQTLRQRPPSLWRYVELLPIFDEKNIISMGEGFTPLLPLANLGLMLGYQNVYIKDERQGPTGSFKDRQASLAMSVFKEGGIDEVVVASTGNVAISYSAYSARAGIKLWAFLTSAVPADKMRETTLYGTEVIKISDTYDRTKEIAQQFAQRKGFFLDKGVKNLAAKESMKTLAFEIAEQLGLQRKPAGGFVAPDWYVQAVSGGLGPVGVWKGFYELKQMGLIDKMPKLALIQAQGCAPMVNSFKANLSEAQNVLSPTTLITTLATGSPGQPYTYLRNIIQNTGGHMEAVSDDEAFRAMHVLAQMDGISMEPAAAVACAGFLKLVQQQRILPHEVVVINCSGHTFPVEKHLLDERKVQNLNPIEAISTLPNHIPLERHTSEGLWTALDTLDERVKSIAIIEDDPNAARLLRRILQAQGNYNLLEAQDGEAGFEIIKHNHPDLVLLDLMMPKLDGFGLLELMKKDDSLKNTPVIVVTAKELTLHEKQKLNGQVDVLLQKGNFMQDDLLEGIVDVLER